MLRNPGDECRIREGYYHETVTINGLEGTEDEPIRNAVNRISGQ